MPHRQSRSQFYLRRDLQTDVTITPDTKYTIRGEELTAARIATRYLRHYYAGNGVQTVSPAREEQQETVRLFADFLTMNKIDLPKPTGKKE